MSALWKKTRCDPATDAHSNAPEDGVRGCGDSNIGVALFLFVATSLHVCQLLLLVRLPMTPGGLDISLLYRGSLHSGSRFSEE